MACEVVRREIANSAGELKLITTTQLAASKALDLYVELMNKAGTSVLPFINDTYKFGDIIAFMRSNEEKEVTALMKRVISMATLEGQEIKPALFDMQFNGELMLACKVFAFVLESNYKDFFMQGLEMNEQRRSAAEEASKQAELKNSSQATTSQQNSPT